MKVEYNDCSCHPETCSCNPYKVVLPYGEKVTFYLRKDAERFVEWTNKK